MRTKKTKILKSHEAKAAITGAPMDKNCECIWLKSSCLSQHAVNKERLHTITSPPTHTGNHISPWGILPSTLGTCVNEGEHHLGSQSSPSISHTETLCVACQLCCEEVLPAHTTRHTIAYMYRATCVHVSRSTQIQLLQILHQY